MAHQKVVGLSFQDMVPPTVINSPNHRAKQRPALQMLATALYENTRTQRRWHLALVCCSQMFNTFLHTASPEPHSDPPYRGEN